MQGQEGSRRLGIRETKDGSRALWLFEELLHTGKPPFLRIATYHDTAFVNR